MQPNRTQLALLLLIKVNVAVLIVVLLFAPTRLQRQEYNNGFAEIDVSVTVGGKHHFCRRPDGRAIGISDGDVLAALDLPNGSKILSNDLLEYGQCRAKAARSNDDREACVCTRRWPFVCMIVFGIACALLNFAHVLFGPRPPNILCAVCKIMESFVWASLATAAVVCHVLDTGSFAPIGSSAGQAYFKVSVQWASACALAYLYAVLTALDGLAYYGLEPSKNVKRRVKQPNVKSAPFRELPTEDYAASSLEKLDKEQVLKLMDIRRVVEPHYTVVTVFCKTWP